MYKSIYTLMILLALPLTAMAAKVPPAFPFEEDDRIVFVGATTLEREYEHGYIETYLTVFNHDKNLTFRNLAWSGDTVWGESRASFDTAKEGFERMVTHIHEAKPTVIMLQFGQNESFAGEAGLEHFLEGYNHLLDTLSEIEARIVFLSPTLHENLGPPLPDPTERNKDIHLYADAIKTLAEERKGTYLDLTRIIINPHNADPVHLTYNSLHFTAYGHWKFAQRICQALGYHAPKFQTHPGGNFEALSSIFFTPALPEDAPNTVQSTEVYHAFMNPNITTSSTFTLDDASLTKQPIDGAPGYVRVEGLPEIEQAEALRAAIIEKNRLFFNRWRPQNETYIYGFRKHEQGRYAEEIPQYDPLIEAQEARIRELSTPPVSKVTLHLQGGTR